MWTEIFWGVKTTGCALYKLGRTEDYTNKQYLACNIVNILGRVVLGINFKSCRWKDIKCIQDTIFSLVLDASQDVHDRDLSISVWHWMKVVIMWVSMLFNIKKISGQYDVASSPDWWHTCYTSRDKLGHLWPSTGPPSPSQMDPTPHGSMHCCAPHTLVERCASLETRLGGCRHHCLCQNTSQYSNTSIAIIRKSGYMSVCKSCPYSLTEELIRLSKRSLCFEGK